MFDFSKLPFFDNHTHELNMSKTEVTTFEFTIHFLHGFRDILPTEQGGQFGLTDELKYHINQFGVVKTMVHYLSKSLAVSQPWKRLWRKETN